METVLEIKYSRFIAIGLFLTTIAVIAGPVSDPVNSPKLLTLAVFSLGSLPYILNKRHDLFTNQETRIQNVLALVFLFSGIVAVFLSSAPISQSVYGAYGRNTGYLTFLFFVIIFLTLSQMETRKSISLIVHAMLLAGLANIIYSLVYKFFKDPIPWNNIYGAFLGTFGNPNFAGAYLGITGAAFLAYLLVAKGKNRFITLVILLLNIYAIYLTKTTQGVLVFGISSGIVVYAFLSKTLKARAVSLGFLFTFLLAGIFALLGIFQYGPLSSVLYKRSVSLRGVYWDAAFSTGKNNPIFGVGFDGFTDWYRRARSMKAATWFPGPETITNSAHNYYLDIFASGGIILFLTYAGLTLVGFNCCLKIFNKIENYDFLAITLIASFVGFQAQALISIQQIGIAVWGWVLLGLLVSYNRILQKQQTIEKSKPKIKPKISSSRNHPFGVLVFIGMSIGFLLGLPPYSADAKLMSAIKSQKLEILESALEPNYFNPQNSDRQVYIIWLLEKNNLHDKAHMLTLSAIKFNNNNFNAWRALYFARNSTPSERKTAFENMKRLDPRNKKLVMLT